MNPTRDPIQEKIEKLRQKYPDRIPLVITKAHKNGSDQQIDPIGVHKLLVPNEYTLANVIYVLRKRLPKLLPQQGIFLFLESSVMPAMSTMVQAVYDAHKGKDGALHMTYALENTFGASYC